MKSLISSQRELLAKVFWLFLFVCVHREGISQTNAAAPVSLNTVSPAPPSLPSLPDLLPPQSSLEPKSSARSSAAQNFLMNAAERLAFGPPLEATIRQRVWVEDKTIVGVGHYQQLGQGMGKYRLEMVLPLGDSKSELVQVNDGHLAWSSQSTGETVRIWRVDVMRLDDLASQQDTNKLPPRLRVIGIIELLDALARDYQLELFRGVLNDQAVVMAQGYLTPQAEQRLLAGRGVAILPKYVPNYVRVAFVADTPEIPSMPVRIEYWQGNPQDVSNPQMLPRAVGLWEVTKYQIWMQPDERRFQFPSERLNVDAENRTDEYAQRFTNNRSVAMLPARR